MEDASFAALVRRVDALEAGEAIRRLVSSYFELCDKLHQPGVVVKIGELFTDDAVWRGSGQRYARAFGERKGRADIVDMMSAYAGPPAHFSFNAHFLCGGWTDVVGDGARGGWMMLQASTYQSGESDLRAASLELRFRRENRVWRIAQFDTRALFSRTVDRWLDTAPIPIPAGARSERF
jgi:hypothetical protein